MEIVAAETYCVAPSAGLVSLWRGEHNAHDQAGINQGLLQDGIGFGVGLVGQAFSFDGISNHVTIPASASLDVGGGSGLTIECWIKPAELSVARPLVEYNDGVHEGVQLWISEPWWANQGGPGDVFANIIDSDGGTHALVSAPGILTTNQFHHVAVTYDQASGLGVLYADGVVVFAAHLGTFTPRTSANLHLGLRPAGSLYPSIYSGLMDEVSVYSRALTTNEIHAIFAAGNAGKCQPTQPQLTNCAPTPSGLVNWWAAESSATDGIGNVHGTMYGGTTFAPGKVGQAFSFDGVNDSVTNATFGLTNILDSYTMELWAWPTASRASTPESNSGTDGHANQRYAIFPYPGPTGGTVGSGISVGTNGVSVFEAGNAYLPALLVFDAPIIGWTHIAVVYSNRVPSLYLNGVLVRTGLPSVNPSCPSTWLGERGPVSANQGFYAGLLDEVSIYDRSLSAAEIQAIYAAGSSGKCTTPSPTGTLLNVNFAAYDQVKTGFAATGQTGSDFWNNLTFPFQNSAGLGGLKQADGVLSGAGLTVLNGGGHTGFSHPDLMYQSCSYAQDLGVITLTVTNLPTGGYDFYLYGHAGDSTANTVFQLLVGDNNFGNQSTATNSSWSLINWIEGAQYVVYRGVTVTNGGAPVVVKCRPGVSGYTYLNGLQIFATSSTPPVIASQPASLNVPVGANATFSVTADGTAPLGYQWSFNGTAINGATASSLVRTNVQLGDAGNYAVVVSNSVSTVTSSNAVLTVNPTSPCAAPAAGLVSWWRADGDANDSFGGNHGSLAGGVVFGASKVGQGFYFNGSDAQITISASASLDVGAGAGLTIEAWIKPASVTTMMPVVEWNSGSGGNPYGVHLWTSVGSDGNLFANLVDTAGNYHGVQTVPGLLTTGAFQHVALSYDKTTGQGKLYLNGQVVAQENLGTFTPQTRHNCYLGFRPAGGVVRYTGELDESSLYARALSDAEIQAIYGAGTAGKCAVPVSPFIISQPANQTVTAGNSATFTVTAGGTPPLNYQWRFNGNVLPGQTGTTLTLTNVQPAGAGNYSVVVSNGVESVTSSNALLTVLLPPATVQVVGTSAMAGSPIEVPVILVANGNENALSFSLNFNTQRLAFAGITLGSGASGAALLPNTTQVGSGRLGIAVALETGSTFAAGTQEVVIVEFSTSILGGNMQNSTPIRITNQPINKLLADSSAQPLPVTYLNGTVTLSPTDLEGDASPRPGGNRSLDIFDWVQVGRYVAALDTVSDGSEYQRVDCAPRPTLGDGKLKVTDWVQAGRYAAGLDPLSVIGGPAAPILPRPVTPGPSVRNEEGTRLVRIASGEVVNGLTVTLPVLLQSLGNENGLGFSLDFDSTALQYVGAVRGSAASSATLHANSAQAASGKVGLVLVLPTGSNFAVGDQEIVRVTFTAKGSVPGKYPVVLDDQPVWRAVSDSTALELTTVYLNNEIVVHGSPVLAISQAGTNVILSWPGWAGDFTLQTADATPGSTMNWSSPAFVVQTNGANVSVVSPASGQPKYFRLFHP